MRVLFGLNVADSSHRRHCAAFAGIVILATTLRVFELTSRSLWIDEALSFLTAEGSLADAVRMAKAEGLPALWNVSLHLWRSIFDGELFARLLPVLAGVATVPLVYRIGSGLAGRRAGLVAALLLATSPIHVLYSQELRVYSLQTFLAAASSAAFLKLLDSERRLWPIVYGIVTALFLHAQYTSGFLLIAHAAFALFDKQTGRTGIRRLALGFFVAAIGFSPWIPSLLAHVGSRMTGFGFPPFHLGYVLGHAGCLVGGLPNAMPLDPVLNWTAVAVLAATAAVALSGTDRRRAAAFALLWLVVPTMCLALASLKQNLFLSRALLYTFPGFFVLIGTATAATRNRSVPRIVTTLAVIAILTGHGYGLYHYYADPNPLVRPPHREIAERIASECETGDLILHTSALTFRPYQATVRDSCEMGVLLPEMEEPPAWCAVIGKSRLPGDDGWVRRIWVVAYSDHHFRGLDQATLAWMRVRHEQVEVIYKDPWQTVALFKRNPLAPAWPKTGG